MSLMNVGVSALIANQHALTTTGHNIANVNSAGYSRQSVTTIALVGQNMGSGFIGKGVQVSNVLRNYNELLGKQSNAATATSAADAIRYQSLMQMQDVYSGGSSSLGAAINNMMNAFADVEAAPSDGTARNVVLSRISELTARFRAASDTLKELDYSTKQRLNNDVVLVNSLASQVATLNGKISQALASGYAPNDLLDARDQIIREINQYVQTSQVDTDNGQVSLFIGGSQALVMGTDSASLSVAETKEYPGSQKLSLYFQQPKGQQVELSADMVSGGEIAGLLKFNNDDLVTGQNLLGRLALSIGTELNNRNMLGLTLSGSLGTELFKLDSTTEGWSNISGFTIGDATATVTDSSKLLASDYKVIFGSNHPADTKITRLSDNKSWTLTPSATPADGELSISTITVGANTYESFTLDGLNFRLDDSIGSNTVAGQSILFQPFNKAASEIQALVHNPDDLAVSNAISANITSSNAGTLQLSSLVVNTTTGIPAQGAPVALRFNGDGTISFSSTPLAGGGYSFPTPPLGLVQELDSTNALVNVKYESGKPFTVNGWSIQLTGTPQPDANGNYTDTVVIQNAKDLGDGYKLNAGNASAFLALRDKVIFDGGTSLSDGFSSAMAVVGTRTQSAQYAAQLSETVAKNLDADRTAVSGVNLDEEAARLLQYQQAYQASAKIIQTAQSLFDSVLNAVGG